LTRPSGGPNKTWKAVTENEMSGGSVPKCYGCIISLASKKPLFRTGEENAEVFQNPHVDPDHQQLIISRGSSFADACHV